MIGPDYKIDLATKRTFYIFPKNKAHTIAVVIMQGTEAILKVGHNLTKTYDLSDPSVDPKGLFIGILDSFKTIPWTPPGMKS